MQSKNKKILLITGIVVVSVGFIFLIFLGVRYYQQLKSPKSPVISAVPSTAGLIVEINNTITLWEKLSKNTAFWKELSQIEPFKLLNSQLIYADSLIKKSDDAKSLLETGPMYISFHPAAQKPCNFLFLKEFSNRENISSIESIFDNLYLKKVSCTKTKFKDVSLLEIKISNSPRSLFFAAYKGVLMCSTVRTLVEDAILQLNSAVSFFTDKGFTQVAQTVGKKVDANIYINYKQFQQILLQLINENDRESISFLPYFGQWTGLDLNIENNAIILNGFTNSQSNNDGFLNLIAKQTPQKVEVTRLLPHNTSSFIFFGFENFKLYFENSIKQKEKHNTYKSFKSDIDAFSNNYGVNIERDIVDCISSEIAFATLVDNSVGDSLQNFLFIRFKDREKLNELSKLLTIKSKTKLSNVNIPDTTSYREYKFGYFDYPEIFNSILGTSLNISDLYSHTMIDNYLVLGRSRNALINIINAVVFNRNLNNSETYNSFSNLLSTKANVYFYFNTAQSFNLLKSYVSKNIAMNIDQYNKSIVRFESFAIQISENNGLFYNNICITYNPNKVVEKTSSLWETELEKPASDKIYKVINHNDNSNEVLVRDDKNNIYLIDRSGIILWKVNIGENILSDLIQIDFYNNGKLQYLFNTPNFIYVVDRNGQNVANFPVKLKHKATNGLSVFDYDNNKNYRIFLATEKNELINLDKNAEKVDGWSNFKTQNPVQAPIQFIRLLGKDFLIATDTKGKMYILDRKGDIRIKQDKPLEKSVNNIFYPLITPEKKGKFVTTSKTGKVITIDFNGKTEESFISDFSENHFFIFEDINNNSLKEYIFIDNKKLSIYDLNKVLVKEYSFDGAVDVPPVYFYDNNKYKLGVVTNTGKIYLFNNEMELVPNFPLNGNIPFVIESNENAKSYIIAANQKIVYKYLLE